MEIVLHFIPLSNKDEVIYKLKEADNEEAKFNSQQELKESKDLAKGLAAHYKITLNKT